MRRTEEMFLGEKGERQSVISRMRRDGARHASARSSTHDLQDSLHLLVATLGERHRHVMANTSIVHEHANVQPLHDAFKALPARLGSRVVRRRQIEFDRLRLHTRVLAFNLLAELLERGLATPDEHEIQLACGELARKGLADTRRRARDDGPDVGLARTKTREGNATEEQSLREEDEVADELDEHKEGADGRQDQCVDGHVHDCARKKTMRGI